MKQLLLILLLCFSLNGIAEEFTLTIRDEVDIPITRYPADGKQLLLMLPSEHGFQPGHAQLAQRLAASGIEVWQADLYAASFLPVSPSSLDAFSTQDIAGLIEGAAERANKTGKSVYLLSHDRGAVPLLKGLRQWQVGAADKVIDKNQKRLQGVIMISPNLYVGTPAAGQEIKYRPIAKQTNFNFYVVQPMLSPKSWQLPVLMQILEQGGSDVYIQPVKGIRDRFFFRPDASVAEDKAAEQLIHWIQRALPLTAHFQRPRALRTATSPSAPKADIKMDTATGPKTKAGKAQKGFRLYRGSFQAQDFQLADLQGRQRKLSGYRGKVVLLNFWASWCPPCIHEMPSMQALKDRFKGRPFEIVAVNMAEDRQTIRDFLKQMDVDFEILLDSDGRVLQQWKVFAYPTSYVLDADGRIRYAGFGAIDWAEVEVVKAVEDLLP